MYYYRFAIIYAYFKNMPRSIDSYDPIGCDVTEICHLSTWDPHRSGLVPFAIVTNNLVLPATTEGSLQTKLRRSVKKD